MGWEDTSLFLEPPVQFDAYRPSYHLQPYAGWLNDPNGPVFYKGRYHMFYQHLPEACEWDFGIVSFRVWGHSVSEDLIHWRQLPPALVPTPGGLDADGCFSGCCVLDPASGLPALLYTGVRLRSNAASGPPPPPEHDLGLVWIESQIVAVPAGPADDLLVEWVKHERPFLDLPPNHVQLTGWRDPFIYTANTAGVPGTGFRVQEHRMLIGSGIKGQGGTALVYSSPNIHGDWRFVGELCTGSSLDTGFVWECPLLEGEEARTPRADGSLSRAGSFQFSADGGSHARLLDLDHAPTLEFWRSPSQRGSEAALLGAEGVAVGARRARRLSLDRAATLEGWAAGADLPLTVLPVGLSGMDAPSVGVAASPSVGVTASPSLAAGLPPLSVPKAASPADEGHDRVGPLSAHVSPRPAARPPMQQAQQAQPQQAQQAQPQPPQEPAGPAGPADSRGRAPLGLNLPPQHRFRERSEDVFASRFSSMPGIRPKRTASVEQRIGRISSSSDTRETPIGPDSRDPARQWHLFTTPPVRKEEEEANKARWQESGGGQGSSDEWRWTLNWDSLPGHPILIGSCPRSPSDIVADGLKFELESARGPFRLDLGDVLYAPNVLQDREGRWLLWGWLQEKRRVGSYDYAGCLTLPRELHATPDGRLVQAPLPEVGRLRQGGGHAVRDVVLPPTKATPLEGVEGDCLDIVLTLERGGAYAAGLLFKSYEAGDENGAACSTTGRRGGWSAASTAAPTPAPHTTLLGGAGRGELRRVGGPLAMRSNDALHLRILLDHSCLEVFTGTGEVLSTRVYRGTPPPGTGPGIDLICFGAGPAHLRSLAAWELRALDAATASVPLSPLMVGLDGLSVVDRASA
ncbi:Beta-fructofuranosidase, insoluble isoenzyme CWINV6 [Auxenochlorella protothecoides]|uniref:beta-fructofuranosidase n=1 Tax=Auxenochlorella protothecoides TaxID=3075 RepID=A0A087SE33_AUXPR|nr:Beta-fructofuranosidase, insoluble isoenzyme CWINV6 [Auxenochlorella protothecoides]KFM23987.1 Beta-fructofuranosidase, insoluble isoenzyme CWINV6 [Auxenochlorella protothecoides]